MGQVEKYQGEKVCDKRHDNDDGDDDDDDNNNNNNNNNKLITHKHFILEFTINDTHYRPQPQYTPSTDRAPVAHISSLTLHMLHTIQNTTTKMHFVFPPFASTPEFSCASQTKVWGTEVWRFGQIQLWATTTDPLTRESVINIRFHSTATRNNALCRVAK